MNKKPPVIVKEIVIFKEKPGGLHWGIRKEGLRERHCSSNTPTCKATNLCGMRMSMLGHFKLKYVFCFVFHFSFLSLSETKSHYFQFQTRQ